jgi:acetyltransferase-like isoleucine patch superfamily enzyme
VIIGANSVVHPYAVLAPYNRGSIVIGENSSINPYSIIYGHGGTKIGNKTRIAANCVIIPASHNFEFDENGVYRDTGVSKSGIIIGDDVWIGAGCTILDGVNICNRCIIAAGSVVNRSISTPGLYAGVPATLKRELSEI